MSLSISRSSRDGNQPSSVNNTDSGGRMAEAIRDGLRWRLGSALRCNIFACCMQAARCSPRMIGNMIHQIDGIGSPAQKKRNNRINNGRDRQCQVSALKSNDLMVRLHIFACSPMRISLNHHDHDRADQHRNRAEIDSSRWRELKSITSCREMQQGLTASRIVTSSRASPWYIFP